MLMLLCCPNVPAQRMVFAHYMLTNQDYQADDDPSQEAKIAAYEREIQQARALGIDGFVLNAGGWLKQPYYVRYAAQMFEAAARLGNGFKLMFSADFCCGNTTADAEDMLRRFANDPRYAQIYFRHRGRFVLTTFAGDKLGAGAWMQLRKDLASGGNPSKANFPGVIKEAAGPPRNTPMKIFFVPAFFWGGELPDRATVERELRNWNDVVDGSFYWGIAGVPGSGGALDSMHSSEAYAAASHARHKLYMAPVTVQFWGANASRYYEYSGGSGMRAMWIDAILRSKPEWVEIITWNDFIEGTYISPIDDPNRYPGANFLTSSGIPGGTLGYFHSHAGAGDLMSYYIRWYKSGVKPPVDRDAIYWFYRTQMAASAAGIPPVRNRYGPVADSIYVTANLKAPATLQIESGGRTSSVSLTAGSQDVSVPFAPGPPPRFSLLRDGSLVLAAIGHDSIDDSPTYNNFYYSTGECVGSMSNSIFTKNEHGTCDRTGPH
jgi:glucan endo-1,3-alpha-glucosidase